MVKKLFCILLSLNSLFIYSSFAKDADESWGIDWDAIGTAAVEVGSKVQETILTDENIEAWTTKTLGGIQSLLDTADLESLAGYAPYVHQVETYLRQFPDAEPWLDWLAQRADYFDFAEEQIHPTPAPTGPPTRVPSPPPTRRSLPNPSGPVISDAPGRQVKAAAPTPDYGYWKGKMSSRPLPGNAASLVPRIKPIFEQNGVPPELVWLAEVESSFNPKAKSPVGARGLFQFMPATAEEYGLSTHPRDQRLDPEKSADAASRYLNKLYQRFDDWPLAIAAYNAGGGRVNSTLRKHKGQTFDDIAPHLPRETRMYVPKVLAAVAAREGIEPGSLAPAR